MKGCQTLLIATHLALSSLAQIADPSLPLKVIEDHVQDLLSSTLASRCEAACARIALKIPSQVHFAPSLIHYIWSAQQGEITPACRVEPTSADEVSFIYGVVKEEKCHFAVKSGGHSRTPSASNADGGVTIDLARINKVELSKDQQSVHVGAGCQWVDVYRAVEREGLSVVGGRVADVGVGGLLTGGGLSYLSNRYGWGCDNILSYQVLLPYGTITNVDSKNHPDLYRALRGAGQSNFGIITSFELETRPLPNKNGFWQSFTFRSWDQLDILLDEQYKLLTEKTAKDQDAVYLHSYGYDPTHKAHYALTMHYHISHPDTHTYPEAFAAYENLSSVAPPDTRVLPCSNLTEILKALNPEPGKRNAYFTFTHRPSREMDRGLLDILEASFEKTEKVAGYSPTLVVQPIYQNALRLMSKHGGNALGLAQEAETGPLNIVLLPTLWEHAADDEVVYATNLDIIRKGEELAKSLGVYHPYKYVNYAEGLQDVVAGYGEENLRWLRKVQREYDPEGVFASSGLAGGYLKLDVGGDDESERREKGRPTQKMEARHSARDEL